MKVQRQVILTVGEKARLKKHLNDLKVALENSSLSEKLKANLRRRLKAFEGELVRESSSMATILVSASLVVTSLGAAATATLAGVEKAEDVVIKLPALLEAITKITAEAKAEQIERSPEQKALPTPPKALPSAENRQAPSGPREVFSADLDDEIPF